MPKPLPPARARDAKSALRRAGKAAREATIAWTTLRDIYKAGNAGDSQGDIITATLRFLMSKAATDEQAAHAEAIGLYTLRMWNAEAALETAAARWREVLAERTAMPVADRWDLAALERWAAALDKAGAA